MVETPAIGDAMADAKTYCYEVYTTRLDTEQMVLIQIFRDQSRAVERHTRVALVDADPPHRNRRQPGGRPNL